MLDVLEVVVDVVFEPVVVVGGAVGRGVDCGGSGGVGQFWSAGLNAVGDGVGLDVVDDVVAVPLGVAVGDGVGVETYGVYEGQLASGGTGGALAPATISEIATAMAPTSTVATNVTAPHSRLKRSFTRPLVPARHAPTARTQRRRGRAPDSSGASRPACPRRGGGRRTRRPRHLGW